MMKSTGKFKDVFERVDRRIELNEFGQYSCVGVQLYGQGAFIRESKLGSDIRKKTQWILKEGDFVYNKLFAWKGTFAVADKSVDGSIVSDKFPTYTFDRTKLNQRYLEYFIQNESLWKQAEKHSKGAAALSKFTLNPPDFWKLEFPLPSLDEQESIVQFLDETLSRLAKVREERAPIDAVVQGRRAGIGSESRLIMSSALQQLNDQFSAKLGQLDNVLLLKPRSGPSFPCDRTGEGIRVIMPSCLGGYRLDESKSLYGNGSEEMSEKDILVENDLLISRGNKRDQVGLCVVYKPSSKVRSTYANLLMRMTVDLKLTLPEFVKLWIMTPLAVRYIRENTKGTSPAIQKINQGALLRMPFPSSVAVSKQQEWVAFLNSIFEKVEGLEVIARQQDAQIQELRRNILLKIFAGERAQFKSSDTLEFDSTTSSRVEKARMTGENVVEI